MARVSKDLRKNKKVADNFEAEDEEENEKDTETEKEKARRLFNSQRMLKDVQNVFSDSLIPERNVVFCIDTSGSMHKMLDIIKEHLVVTIGKHAAKENSPFFNIVEFSTNVTVWCEKMVPCTESTVKVAKRWLSQLSAQTGTNTRDALLAALDFAECEAVYLVTDGLPDSDLDELLDSLAYASHGRPVHVIYVCTEDEDVSVSRVLRQIAQETSGNFRVVAFGKQAVFQRAVLLQDEPPTVKQVRTKQGGLYADEAMCGVRVYPTEAPASRAVFHREFTDATVEAGYAQPTALGRAQDPLRDPLVRPQQGSGEQQLLQSALWAAGPPPSATWSRYRPSRAFIAAKEKQFRQFDQASKVPVAGALLIGKTVLCRLDDRKQAYYRKGQVKSQVRESVYLVELPPVAAAEYATTEYHEATVHNLIAYDDALRHPVRRGDRVLAPVGRGKFLPGTVTDGEEWREPLCVVNDRPLNVLLDDGKSLTVPHNTTVLITEDTFRRLTLEAKMPPGARADLHNTAGYPERSLPGYPVDPLPRQPHDYAHAKPSLRQSDGGLLVDHLTPDYHVAVRLPSTDCSCYDQQPQQIASHAVSLDLVQRQARTERDYPSDDEKQIRAAQVRKAVRTAASPSSSCSSDLELRGRERKQRMHSACTDCVRCHRKSQQSLSESESELDRHQCMQRKAKTEFLEDWRLRDKQPLQTAKSADWYQQASRVIHADNASSASEDELAPPPPFIDSAQLDKRLLRVRERLRKVKVGARKQGKRPQPAASSSSSSSASSSSSSASSESESESDVHEMSSREQQTDEKAHRRKLERLLQSRRRKRSQLEDEHIRIDRTQLRSKQVQAGPPAKPPWRYWKNGPPSNLRAPATFDAYRDPAQPVNSVELHPVRKSSANASTTKADKSAGQPRKQQGYVEKEQQILQRRFEEAMRREEERQERRVAKCSSEQQAALRQLHPEVAQAKAEQQRGAIRERIAHELAVKHVERAQRDLTFEQQREAQRVRQAAEQETVNRLRATRRDERSAELARERQGGEQQLRLARVACEEAARMHNELSRVNAETALNLRKYEVRKEVNQEQLGKFRLDA